MTVAPSWIRSARQSETSAVWTRSLAAELAPGPVLPLEYDLFWRAAAESDWRDRLVAEHGFRSDELPGQGAGLIEMFDGYAYVNASLLRGWAARMPGMTPDHIDQVYLGHHPALPAHREEAEGHGQPGGLMSDWLNQVLAGHGPLADGAQTVADRGRAPRLLLTALSDWELFELVIANQPRCRLLFADYVSRTLAASVGPGILSAICREIGLPIVHPKLIAGLGELESVAPARALWALSRAVRRSPTLTAVFDARCDGLRGRLEASDQVEAGAFIAGLDAFLREVGFIGPAEWQMASPSWESEPALALAAIDWMRGCSDDRDPALGLARREAERTTVVKEVGDIVAARCSPVTQERFNAAIASTAVFVRARGQARAGVSRVVNDMRLAVAELGRRAAARQHIEHPEDLYLLFVDELASYAEAGGLSLGELVAERRTVRDRVVGFDPPLVIEGGTEPRPLSPLSALFGEVTAMVEGEVLLAEPGSAGRSRGIARIMISQADQAQCAPGDILVVGDMSLTWLPSAIGLAGLVVEAGGALSPPAVIGRELGLPVVVDALDAASRIPDGALVEIDGETGVVTLIAAPGTAEASEFATRS